jgi:NAD-dependent SIR2 family protein deacetylase
MADKCVCVYCSARVPFDLPGALVDACAEEKVVVFAGAGISTENRLIFPWTFYEDIHGALVRAGDISPDQEPSFPAAMSLYVNRFGRPDLLRHIKERFDYLRGFPELYHDATRFHRELATIHPLKDLITTNWDTLFEEATAATPIVTASDYAFWDLPGRKVFKIHGSMANPGSVVATEEDYRRCYRNLRTGVIGASLKHLLATKTVVFVGYSFGDEAFNRLYGFLRREMADTLPRSYIVTPDKSFTVGRFPSSTVMHTDGTYFLTQLKDALVQRGVMRPDSIYALVDRALDKLEDEHRRLGLTIEVHKRPAALYTFAYQDGVQDACQRILSMRRTGHYSNPHTLHQTALSYQYLQRLAVQRKRYYDAAYIEGYLNGLVLLGLEEEEFRLFPYFFLYGAKTDLRTRTAYLAALPKAPSLHKAAFRVSVRIVNGLAEGIVPEHIPFLEGILDA